jgi:hypothetical protein
MSVADDRHERDRGRGIPVKHLKVVLLILLLPIAVAAQKKPKKPSLPVIFDHARYVYVEAMDGGEMDRNVYPEDRRAIADVRAALKQWGRYALTMDRSQAELVFVVRKGRLAAMQVNGGIRSERDAETGTPGGQPASGRQPQEMPSFGAGSEVGPPDDLMQVCQLNANGKLSGPIWYRSLAQGLNEPKVALVSLLKEAVEKAYPSTTPPPPTDKP